LGPRQIQIRNEEKKMKKTLVMLAFVLALVLAAAAQENLTFADLPLMSSPTLMPNGYGQLNWTNIFYVNPSQWSGAGPGYKDGPIGGISRPQDVAFVGSKACRLAQEACFGTISVNAPLGFQAVSATVAGGFGPTHITVFAYNNGTYVGSAFYSLTTSMQTLNFPSSWGGVSQLTFQTEAGGDLVFYDLQVYLLGG
jgi:hypothetical protein